MQKTAAITFLARDSVHVSRRRMGFVTTSHLSIVKLTVNHTAVLPGAKEEENAQLYIIF